MESVLFRSYCNIIGRDTVLFSMGYLVLTVIVSIVLFLLTKYADKLPTWGIILIQLFCSAYIAIAQFLTGHEFAGSKTLGFACSLLFEEKIAFSIAATTILLFATGANEYGREKRGRQYRLDILDVMIRKMCKDDKLNFRITIFHDVGFFKESWINAHRLCLYYLPIGISKGKDFKRSHYIAIDQRIGTEYKKSKRYFPWSQGAIDECQGVAARARSQESMVCVADAPDISSIDVKQVASLMRETQNRKNKKEVSLLSSYMKATYINDLHLVSKLNWHATAILAQPIFKKDGNIVGVLVIDARPSNEHKNLFNHTDFQREVDIFVQLIGKTY